ncbi:hypothetical protein JYU34_012620 [Plutella xylostella]|uniref:Transmembrane protein 186 n=1 Tax=Plutella xylostella TaxID=51655 RepID=A0ABQ7QBR5_PLUXY|nr:hypothetical protein JYU34_012620 [Plutella xylostella]
MLRLKQLSSVYRSGSKMSRTCTSATDGKRSEKSQNFETVFSFPFVKYFAIVNRLKVYQLVGSSIAIPSSAVLEMLNIVPQGVLATTAYIGITVGALLSIATIPFRNIIGFIYISEDNTQIKISALDYWGKRKDRTIPADDWIPLMDLGAKPLDVIYLTPKLSDGSSYKFFLKFGKVHNQNKLSYVLE